MYILLKVQNRELCPQSQVASCMWLMSCPVGYFAEDEAQNLSGPE